MSLLPLSPGDREGLVHHIGLLVGSGDPLSVLQNRIFQPYPEHATRIPTSLGRPPADFYRDVVRYCEISAWAEEPPLIISLLDAFRPLPWSQAMVEALLRDGPFRCHPGHYPYYVARVAAELPLLGRNLTRLAGLSFDLYLDLLQPLPSRVLRVFGPKASGKTYTLAFFRYLAAIQPLKVGLVQIDFADKEMETQAASNDVPMALHMAQRLEDQVRRRRNALFSAASASAAAAPVAGLPALGGPAAPAASGPHRFQPLTDLEQQARWAKGLANEFVDQVLNQFPRVPEWWVIAFDHCELAPAAAHEFVRRLVERAAGTDATTSEKADRLPLRVCLLGESDELMPNPVYDQRVLAEDLSAEQLGAPEVQDYFKILRLAHPRLDLNDERVQLLATESLKRANEILDSAAPPVPWPRALANAVIEKTLLLEAHVARSAETPQARSGP